MKRLILFSAFILLFSVLLVSCGHNHKFSDWEVKSEATCSLEGERTRVCKCGEIETEKIAKTSHIPIQISPVKATCSSVGYSGGTSCSVCGEYIEKPREIPAAHTYVANVISIPTCTSKGSNRYTCTICSSSYVDAVEELGHNYKEATCVAPKHCAKCGATAGAALGHTTNFGTCERCNSFINPTVSIPDLPIETTNGSMLNRTVLKITDISYRFSATAVTFSFSAEKIEDTGFLTQGKNFCGFSYKLYDKNGNLIATDSYALNDLAVGDKVANRTFTIELKNAPTDTYLLVIGDYEG